MSNNGDNSITNEALLRRESALRSITFIKRNAFTNTNARRHFNEGLVRRHYMLQSSRLFLDQHCGQSRKEPLSPYEATDCAIHINAYYLNLRGALDNLAWVLQYEWQLLTGITEDEKNRRNAINLCGKDFLCTLKLRNSDLGFLIDQQKGWVTELAEIRDPAAHRVPIYVPPSVITSSAQLEKFRLIEAEADTAPSERADRSISEIYREAQSVADFMPVMVISTSRGLKMRSISEQIGSDHDKYLKIASAVANAL